MPFSTPNPIRRPDAVERALRFIRDPSGDRFEEVARAVFAYQFDRVPPFRRYCERRGIPGPVLDRWERIPFVPAAAFKSVDLMPVDDRGSTFPAERVFATSGTTRGEEGRGRHAFPDLALYAAAWEAPFRHHLLPGRERMRILSLVPGEDVLPRSSLSYMVSRILERCGGPGSRVAFGRDGLEAGVLEDFLQEAVADRVPVLLLATGLSLLAAIEAMEARGLRVALPPGSRLMDTGGFKGRRRGVVREDLLARAASRLGIPPDHAVGEYGMTELSSQYYETSLRDRMDGRPARDPRIFVPPPWMRPRVLDPETLNPLPPGATGLLAHLDLANAWTVCAVVTEDLGTLHEEGFVFRGRAEGAELRGCSLATEELQGE